MTKVRFVALLAATLVLIGCAGEAGDDDPVAPSSGTSTASTDSIDTETPTPTPTPTPTATGPGALGDLSLSSEGLRYVRVGRPVPAHDPKTAIVTWSDDFCGFENDQPDGGWNTAWGSLRSKPGGIPFLVATRGVKTKPVEAIYVFSDEIHTKHGLHLGSTVVDVKALGGVKVTGTGPDYYDAWVIHGSAGELVFWAANNDKSETPKGVVNQLSVQKEGTKPVFNFEYACE